MKKRTTDEKTNDHLSTEQILKAEKGILIQDDNAARAASIEAFASIVVSLFLTQSKETEI